MERIIQGSNDPIVLEVGEELNGFSKLSAILTSYGKTYKTWELSDVTITEEGNLILPLTENETLALPEGTLKLDIKGLKNNVIEFMEVVKLYVVKRDNHTKLKGDENESN